LDISSEIGTGHFRRMQILLSTLTEINPIYLIKTDNINNKLTDNVNVHFIDDNNEIDNIVYFTKIYQPKYLIFDLLKYKSNLVSEVKRSTNLKLISFHEYKDWDLSADLIVNYNTYSNFNLETNPKILAGPEYCILNPEIKSLERSNVSNGVFVNFGGSDPSNYTIKLLKNIQYHDTNLVFKIHLGPFFKEKEFVIKKYACQNIRWSFNDTTFFKYLKDSKAAISAGGNAMYELNYLNYLPIIVAHNMHQAEFAQNMVKLNGCIYFGMHDTIDWQALLKQLDFTYHRQKPNRIIDGNGLTRISKIILSL